MNEYYSEYSSLLFKTIILISVISIAYYIRLILVSDDSEIVTVNSEDDIVHTHVNCVWITLK